jgi:hypothetical protein
MTIAHTASMTVPETIETMIQQLGGRNINSATCYVGAHNISWKCDERFGEYRSSFKSHVRDDGLINWDVGLFFRVNGKKGAGWFMVVSYEPDDTYSVWLVRQRSLSERMESRQLDKLGEVLAHRDDVYGDELKHTVEEMYDRAILEHNDGWIPL